MYTNRVLLNNKSISILTLIDSGALQANYLDHRTLQRLTSLGLTPRASTSNVCGIFGREGGCHNCRLSIVIPLTINSEVSGHEEVIVIEAHVLEGSLFPLIIGLPDIREYDLTAASHFKKEHISPTLQGKTERIMCDNFNPPC